jgi:hypothetical protein
MIRKRFADFIEAKQLEEKEGFANKNGLVPNQDIPKADKSIPKTAGVDAKSGLAMKDYDGPLSTKPAHQGEKTLPYKSGGKNDTGFVWTAKEDDPKGLGSKGNNILTPSNSMGKEGVTPTSKTKQAIPHKMPKLTSEQFLETTKNMTPKEFSDFLLEDSGEPLPTITDLYGNQFTPDPNQTIEYLAALMLKNPKLMSRLVREVKRQEGGLKGLMGEVYDHPESYDLLVEGWKDPEEGKKRCHRVARAMNEQYMNELNKFLFESKNLNEEIIPKFNEPANKGGPTSSPLGKPGLGLGQPSDSVPKPPMPSPSVGAQGGPMGIPNAGAQGGPMGNPDGGIGGGAIGGGSGPGPDKIPGGDIGGGDQGGAGPMSGGQPAQFPGPTASQQGMPDQQGMPGKQGFDNGMPKPPPGPPGMPQGMRAKLKESMAHDNLISEMGGFPHMFEAMANHCLNCRDNKS